MSKSIKRWDIWFADFPYEDDGRSSDRPVIVLSVKPLLILSIKVTTHKVRLEDPYDTEITYWEHANLAQPSVARISKTIELKPSAFRRYVGTLHPQDAAAILSTYFQYVCDSKKMVEKENSDYPPTFDASVGRSHIIR